mmetsp:Transcript_15973/g.48798  ORF Transcript_15973/g.48798 Transcript_15973/m.48798 type:complete len:246 (-) Transcript_15973:516-1253(-)
MAGHDHARPSRGARHRPRRKNARQDDNITTGQPAPCRALVWSGQCARRFASTTRKSQRSCRERDDGRGRRPHAGSVLPIPAAESAAQPHAPQSRKILLLPQATAAFLLVPRPRARHVGERSGSHGRAPLSEVVLESCKPSTHVLVVPDGRPEVASPVSKHLRKALAQRLARARVVREPEVAADDVFEQARRRRLLRDHVVEHASDRGEAVVGLADVVEARVVREDLLHDEGGHGHGQLTAGLHDA